MDKESPVRSNVFWLAWRVFTVVLAAICSVACGPSAKPPIKEVAKAEFALKEAEHSKAEEYASLELRIAEEGLAQAKAAMDAGDYERASLFAERALADAQLAEARARAATARRTTEEMRRSLETLREELERMRSLDH